MTMEPDWPGLEERHAKWMRWLGFFRPTVRTALKEAKGAMYDDDIGGSSSAYLSADDMRQLSEALIAAADWLERRAEEGVP